MRAINLLPPDRGRSKRQSSSAGRPSRTFLAVGGAGALAVVAGLAILTWSASSSVANKQRQLDALQAKVASLPPAPGPSSSSGATAPARAAVIGDLVQQRLPWDQFLSDFSRVVPEDIWLQSLQASSPGAAAAVGAALAGNGSTTTTSPSATTTTSTSGSTSSTSASGATFSISGFTYSEPSVARLMRRLALIPWLSNVTLVSSVQSAINKTTVYSFSVSATVVPQASTGQAVNDQ